MMLLRLVVESVLVRVVSVVVKVTLDLRSKERLLKCKWRMREGGGCFRALPLPRRFRVASVLLPRRWLKQCLIHHHETSETCATAASDASVFSSAKSSITFRDTGPRRLRNHRPRIMK